MSYMEYILRLRRCQCKDGKAKERAEPLLALPQALLLPNNPPSCVTIMKEDAGRFVLISNVPAAGPPNADVPYDGKMVFKAHEEQNGIEHNFAFLKDPVPVNAIFLKELQGIEVPGLILVISLLIWRLIQLTTRQYLEQLQSKPQGWNKRPAERPTTFMMSIVRDSTGFFDRSWTKW